MGVFVDTAMRDATKALLDADAGLAESVLGGDAELERQQSALDGLALDLLAREQPVATELRTIVACLRMSVDLRRMGKLAVHVAEVARAHCPGSAVPGVLWSTVRAMSEQALGMVGEAGEVLTAKDSGAVSRLEHDDDRVDRLQEELHRVLFADTWDHPVEVAVELALIGRYYERYADHAVELGRRLAYLTGLMDLDGPRAEV